MKIFVDLFSGIGGFALGAYWAGMRFDKHYFSEVDPYAIAVYQKRFPDAEPLGDINKIDGHSMPKGEYIIAGGFPCQDISVAGKGAGLDGGRSGLWFQYARLIDELRPRYAIMENVGALAFRGLDRVLGSLAEIGYDAEWQDIRASDVGAPHRRERIWIVAYSASEGLEGIEWEKHQRAGTGFADEGKDVAHPSSKRFSLGGRSQWPEGNAEASAGMEPESERCGEDVAHPMREQLGERWFATNARQEDRRWNNNHRRKSKNDCWSWWAIEPDVGRVAHGIPARVDRLKCLGNSIIPQIAELIFRQIKELTK